MQFIQFHRLAVYQALGQGVPSGKPHVFAQTCGKYRRTSRYCATDKPQPYGASVVQSAGSLPRQRNSHFAAGLENINCFITRCAPNQVSAVCHVCMAWRVSTIEARVYGSAQDTWTDGEPAVEYHAAINNPGALRLRSGWWWTMRPRMTRRKDPRPCWRPQKNDFWSRSQPLTRLVFLLPKYLWNKE